MSGMFRERKDPKKRQWTKAHLKTCSSLGELLVAGSPVLEAVLGSKDKEILVL